MGSYTVLLAKLISKELLALRRRLSLTQEAMAEQLHLMPCVWRSGAWKIRNL